MAWLFSREEKEKYVIQLYKEGRTVRDIAKQLHMSFGDIGTIIRKVKTEAEREAGHINDQEIDDKAKSEESQAFKLFSEGKTPVQVVIALDVQADEVHAIYREYLELNGMYDALQIYDQIRHSGKYSLPSFLRLHRIVNDLGMEEQQIINVLDLVNHNQLEYLQGKVEYLRNEINNLDLKKAECTNYVLTLNRRIDDLTEIANMYESSLKEKMEEIACMNQELKRLDKLATNNDNVNKNDEGIEIFYASGSWHNLTA